ncbi:MAG: hypothetical protein EOM50_01730 [Erysipelotrichia bacterium]|nr:hypothetical protein [Erysipelotrichia bacterium]
MKLIKFILCTFLLCGCSTLDFKGNDETTKNTNKKHFDLSDDLKKHHFDNYSVEAFATDYQTMLSYFDTGSLNMDMQVQIIDQESNELVDSRNFNAKINDIFNNNEINLIFTVPTSADKIYFKDGNSYVENKKKKYKYRYNSNAIEKFRSFLYFLRIDINTIDNVQCDFLEESKYYFLTLEVNFEDTLKLFLKDSSAFAYGIKDGKIEILIETDSNNKMKDMKVKYKIIKSEDSSYVENDIITFSNYEYQELNFPTDIEKWEYKDIN